MLDRADTLVDLRVQRTRRLLREAFMYLMSQKDFQSITVRDIAEQAQVHRTTFYDHFVDKYELLEDAIHESFRQALLNNALQDSPFSEVNLERLILTTCDFLVQLHQHCLPRVQQVFQLVQTQITMVIAELLTVWLQQHQTRNSVDTSSLQLRAAISSWAIYGAAFHWYQNQQRISVETLTASTLPLIMMSLVQGTPNSENS